MQNRLGSLIGRSVQATDGDLGKVNEFYFDDATWTIRYMVVETGNWLSSRKVLISIVALGKPDEETPGFPVNLTRDQVRDSPDIDTRKPVYRQHEEQLHEHYAWPQYWGGGYGGIFGITPFPVLETSVIQEPLEKNQEDDPHLRSSHQVTGYIIHATDGEIGHVEDFVIDDENWTVRHIVVKTGNWFLERKVLISTAWIKSVDWAEGCVNLDRTRDFVKNSPEFVTD